LSQFHHLFFQCVWPQHIWKIGNPDFISKPPNFQTSPRFSAGDFSDHLSAHVCSFGFFYLGSCSELTIDWYLKLIVCSGRGSKNPKYSSPFFVIRTMSYFGFRYCLTPSQECEDIVLICDECTQFLQIRNVFVWSEETVYIHHRSKQYPHIPEMVSSNTWIQNMIFLW